ASAAGTGAHLYDTIDVGAAEPGGETQFAQIAACALAPNLVEVDGGIRGGHAGFPKSGWQWQRTPARQRSCPDEAGTAACTSVILPGLCQFEVCLSPPG